MNDYKNTLNLGKTDYPMRGNLLDLEKRMLEYWNENNINEKILKKNSKKTFTLQYGPPYANGDLHIGSGTNMLFKDLMLRLKNIVGYNVNTIVSHDCHGLPIELRCKSESKTIKDLRRDCRNFANKYIEIQRETIDNIGFLHNKDKITKTMDKSYEIYECFSKLLLKGFINIHKKPVYWSILENCVIADVDMEYREKESKSLDIALEITNSPIKNLIGTFLVVWTTTPWTLIDNRAVAFNPNIKYLLCEMGEHTILVAESCLESLKSRINSDVEFEILMEIPSPKKLFEDIQYRHPILEEDCPLLPADFVESSEGTGFVHIAPAHGEDDFALGQEFDLDIQESVDNNGYYYNNVPKLNGKHIFLDEEFIIDQLDGKLLSVNKIYHRYPYSTRTGTPLILRSVEQIFISLKYDKKLLEQKFNEIQITPNLLKPQFWQLLSERKEWCISRNRCWGVPLALFIHKETRTLLIDSDVQKIVLQKIKEDPEYFFQENSVEILKTVAEDFPWSEYEPYYGVLEVWFDSGCLWYLNEKELNPISDLYLEGKDQTRGWFQSSLWIKFLLDNDIPYKSILCHGFVVDANGNKMSKSKGNGIDFKEMIEKHGREIMRIWLLNTAFTNDMKWSETLITNCSEMYKKIRYVLRYLTMFADRNSKYKFDSLENFYLIKLHNLIKNYIKLTDTYELNKLFDEIFKFIQDISGNYFNARKDLLYCDNNNSNSTKYMMFILLESLVIMLSPILPFTTEEMYLYMKNSMNYSGLDSVHLNNVNDLIYNIESKINWKYNYDGLNDLLDQCNLKIEQFKSTKQINRNGELILTHPDEFLGNIVVQIMGFGCYKQCDQFEVLISDDKMCLRCHKSIINSENLDICDRCFKYV